MPPSAGANLSLRQLKNSVDGSVGSPTDVSLYGITSVNTPIKMSEYYVESITLDAIDLAYVGMFTEIYITVVTNDPYSGVGRNAVWKPSAWWSLVDLNMGGDLAACSYVYYNDGVCFMIAAVFYIADGSANLQVTYDGPYDRAVTDTETYTVDY